MNDQANLKEETLFDTVRQLLETGALVVDELIESIKPSEADCLRAKRKFWETNARVMAGLAKFAERRAENMETPPPPSRHADKIVVEDDE